MSSVRSARRVIEESRAAKEEMAMAMPLSLATYIVNMVWGLLDGWISSCVIVADEIARALRTGDIGPFPIG
ncbi:hypothetical protein KFK09_015327 [Dendrobium nobile]|uniref:Uncharacterized protein n=1 Tax=Dendrobium nobile TaxID=94219 RepID=A0A8T3B5U3_DENNO|nr:hypothetical protein KFK09_015327 [Dendrobium nobile]